MEKNNEADGKSGKIHRFDAYFDGRLLTWRRAPGPVLIFVRIVKAIRVQDVELMKEAVEDVLSAGGYSGPVRALIVQTESGDISEDVVLYANEHPLEYERSVGVKSVDWTSPVELLAEDPSGTYNIGTFYFG